MAVPAEYNWSYLFTRVLVEKIEPQLGIGRITILDRYPASEAALARRAPDDPRVAERFEIYACGVELANGFGELTDAAEQRRRLQRSRWTRRQRLYGERYPLDEDFLAALAIMPEASGVALGFDRLVMLATGASRIDQVVWVPVADRATRRLRQRGLAVSACQLATKRSRSGGAEGLGEGVALQRVAAELGDDAGVLLGLDAFGDDADAERVADVDDRGDELALAFGLDHRHHQLAVDLEAARPAASAG